MRFNKSLFIIHNTYLFFYLLILILYVICILLQILSVIDRPVEVWFSILLMFYLTIFSYLHYIASNEVLHGTEKGKKISRLLGWVILILGFPVFSVIGIFILFKVSKRYWQSGNCQTIL